MDSNALRACRRDFLNEKQSASVPATIAASRAGSAKGKHRAHRATMAAAVMPMRFSSKGQG